MAVDPGEVAGGSRRVAQLRVESNGDGGSEEDMTVVVEEDQE